MGDMADDARAGEEMVKGKRDFYPSRGFEGGPKSPKLGDEVEHKNEGLRARNGPGIVVGFHYSAEGAPLVRVEYTYDIDADYGTTGTYTLSHYVDSVRKVQKVHTVRLTYTVKVKADTVEEATQQAVDKTRQDWGVDALSGQIRAGNVFAGNIRSY